MRYYKTCLSFWKNLAIFIKYSIFNFIFPETHIFGKFCIVDVGLSLRLVVYKYGRYLLRLLRKHWIMQIALKSSMLNESDPITISDDSIQTQQRHQWMDNGHTKKIWKPNNVWVENRSSWILVFNPVQHLLIRKFGGRRDREDQLATHHYTVHATFFMLFLFFLLVEKILPCLFFECVHLLKVCHFWFLQH